MQWTQKYSAYVPVQSYSALPYAITLLRRAAATILLWHSRQNERQALRDLDGHLLEDIGKTHGQAHAEANKPFWIGPTRRS